MVIGPKATLDDFCTALRGTAVAIGRTLAPDGDWMPMFTMVTIDRDLVSRAIDPDYFATEARKDELVDVVLPALLREHRAQLCALAMTSWWAPPDERTFRLGASRHPDRIEMYSLQIFSGSGTRVETAEIGRFRKAPPQLHRWRTFDEVTGRFARLERHLRLARSVN